MNPFEKRNLPQWCIFHIDQGEIEVFEGSFQDVFSRCLFLEETDTEITVDFRPMNEEAYLEESKWLQAG